METRYTARELFDAYSERLQSLYPEQEAANIVNRLLEDCANWSRVELALNGNDEVNQKILERLEPLIRRLEEGEPVQYVTGQVDFLGCKICVNSNVLIPRPETEFLADHVIKKHSLSSERILDIGTGSGCLAIALKKHCPDARVDAVDVSPEALQVARSNANQNKVDVQFYERDILEEGLSDLPSYDLMVCNPPYVPESERKNMHPNVLEYEPWEALFVNNGDPLVFFRKIIDLSTRHLESGGWLYFEVHTSLDTSVAELMKNYSFEQLETVEDLQQHPRIVKGRKPVDQSG